MAPGPTAHATCRLPPGPSSLVRLAAGLVVLASTQAHAQAYKPIKIGTWAFSPSIGLDVYFQDGGTTAVGQSDSATSLNVSPAFTLTRDGSLGATSLSGSGSLGTDSRLRSEQLALSHTYSFTKDSPITFTASASSSQGGSFSPSSGLVASASTGAVNVFQTGLSVQHRFGRITTFVSASASLSDVQNSGGAPVVVGSSGTGTTTGTAGTSGVISLLPQGRTSTYSLSGGVDYDAPFLSPFVSSSVSWQDQSLSQTRSLQAQAGVRTSRFNLYHAEVHAGYVISQVDRQFVGFNLRSDATSPSIGASITWDPLRYLSVTGGIDATFGSVVLPSVASLTSTAGGTTTNTSQPATVTPSTAVLVPTGQNGTTIRFSAGAQYSFSRQWSASTAFGYTIINSGGTRSSIALASVSANYNWTTADVVTLSYSYVQSEAGLNQILGLPGPSPRVTTSVARLGLRHRF